MDPEEPRITFLSFFLAAFCGGGEIIHWPDGDKVDSWGKNQWMEIGNGSGSTTRRQCVQVSQAGFLNLAIKKLDLGDLYVVSTDLVALKSQFRDKIRDVMGHTGFFTNSPRIERISADQNHS